MPPEMPVEPVPLSAAGESEPFSLESPALSLGVEMPSATRGACGAGTPVGRGGKCTKIAGSRGTFPEGGDGLMQKYLRSSHLLPIFDERNIMNRIC